MIESLRDPNILWAIIIGLASILATAAVAFFIYRKEKKYKAIQFRIDYERQLVNVDEGIAENIQVMYHDQELESLHLVVVTLQNAGNIPILPSDVEKPISLFFESGTKIFSAEIVDRYPFDLQAEIAGVGERTVLFNKFVFNPNDDFTIQFLTDKYRGMVFSGGRISGVDAIYLETTPELAPFAGGQKLITFVGLFLMAATIASIALVRANRDAWCIAVFFAVLVALYSIYQAYSLYSFSRAWRRFADRFRR